jgi:hypothetical protein
VAYFAYVQFGIHPFISIVIAGVLLYALGYAVQAGIINRVLAAPVLITLTLTFGLERALDRASPVPSLIFWRGVPTISPNTTRRLALVASRSTARRDTLVVVGVFLAKLANLAVFDFLPPPALPGAPPFIPVQVSSHDLRLTAKPRQRALHVGPGGRYWTVAHAALRHCRIIVGIVLVWRAMSDLSAEPGTLSRLVAKALGRVRILRMRHPTDGTADSVLSPLAAARPGGCRWRGCVWFARDTIFGRRGPMLCCKCL